MIVVLEQDGRSRNGSRFNWTPHLFRGRWGGGPTWRFGWGMWSISYYPSPGIKEFFDHVEHTEWKAD